MEENARHLSEQSIESPPPSTGDGRSEWQTPVLVVDDVDKVTKGGFGSSTVKPDANYYIS